MDREFDKLPGPRRNLGVWLLIAALAACGSERESSAPAEPAATQRLPAAAQPPPAPPAAPAYQASLDQLRAQALPLARGNHDRTAVCSNLRALAAAVGTCAECLATYARVIEGQGETDVVECSVEDLAVIDQGADRVCAILVRGYETSKSGTRTLGKLVQYGERCGAQRDRVVDLAVAKMDAFADEYDDIGLADIAYLRQLFDHASEAQKTKLRQAATRLVRAANAKHSDRLAASAQELAASR